jgi:hypothetical protein
MTTIIDKGYRVTPEQVEHMAREVGKGVLASQTYLRCLIVAAQESKKRGIRAVNEAHEGFYPAVMRGVNDDRRAANFARTAASTLRAYVKRGGKLSDIDVATATKGTLQKWGQPEEPANRAERSAARSIDALLRAVKRVVKRDAALAKRMVSEAVEALRGVVPAGTRAKTQPSANAQAVH